MLLNQVEVNHQGKLDFLNRLAKLIYNLFAALGIEYIVIGGGAISYDLKSQLNVNLSKFNNSYLPALTEEAIDQRIILDENSDDLAFLGGIYLLNMLS